MHAYGNDPAKIARYRAFWNREAASRPMVSFSFCGWFPFGEFAACRAWPPDSDLTTEMIEPEAFLDDHLRMLREGEAVDDDAIRGACPGQVAIPWLPGMLGCRMRILPDNVLGEERRLPLEDALRLRFDPCHPWFRKYADFAEALVRAADSRFPVSHSAELGATDLHAVLRGHTGSILDLADAPDAAAQLLRGLGEFFAEATREIWRRLPSFCGGWFDAQYSLWAPGPIVRLQEDATAAYSPRLYRRFVQPVDRAIAAAFPNSFIHLHSTSMFLLDAFLEIEELRAFEINNDALGPPLEKMIPCFRRVQDARRPLIIRGSFTPEQMRLLAGSLNPSGLFLNVMVRDMAEVEALRPLLGM